MNCIIIDDDRVAQKALQFLIANTPGLHLAGTFDRAMDAMELIQKKAADLAFLDIEMPEVSGIDLLKNFAGLPQIVVCSSKKEYAADVFEFNVSDYLVKPVNQERFAKAIETVRAVQDNFRPAGKKDDSIFIKHKGYYVSVRPDDILYFEALSDYVNIHTRSQKYTIYSTMRAIEARLPAEEFARIHRSYIIRLDKITVIEENSVFVKDVCLPISKSYRRDFTSRLNFL